MQNEEVNINQAMNHSSNGIKKINRRHEEILMWVAMNPNKTQRQIAKDLGYSESWLSTLMASDMFQARLNKLRETYHSTVMIGVRSRAEAVATLALNRLLELMDGDDELPPGFYLEAATKLLEWGGHNGNTPNAPGGIQVNLNIATEIQAAVASLKNAKQLTAEINTDQDRPALEGQAVGEA